MKYEYWKTGTYDDNNISSYRDIQTVYLNGVIKDLSIEVGDYAIYNNFVSEPSLFE